MSELVPGGLYACEKLGITALVVIVGRRIEIRLADVRAGTPAVELGSECTVFERSGSQPSVIRSGVMLHASWRRIG